MYSLFIIELSLVCDGTFKVTFLLLIIIFDKYLLLNIHCINLYQTVRMHHHLLLLPVQFGNKGDTLWMHEINL